MYDKGIDGAFCQDSKQTHTVGGVWVAKPFRNWKNTTEKNESSSPASHITRRFSRATTVEDEHARKGKE